MWLLRFSVLRETPMTSAIHFKKLKCCKKWQRSREVHRRVPKQGNRAGVDRRIFEVSTRPVHLMEVCGNAHRIFFSVRDSRDAPQTHSPLSGPGCPVCVTPNQDIDLAIALSRRDDVILATFGDHDEGSGVNLQPPKRESRREKDPNGLLSLEALRLARENPEKKIVFLAVG